MKNNLISGGVAAYVMVNNGYMLITIVRAVVEEAG